MVGARGETHLPPPPCGPLPLLRLRPPRDAGAVPGMRAGHLATDSKGVAVVRVMVLVMLATALGGADKESELPFALVDQRDVAALRDLLLQHPELVNARNALGASLLHHAVRQDEPLDCAIRWSKEDVVDVLLGENLPQTSIDAALFTAAMYGRAFFVPKLVKAGAHPDAAALRAAAKDNHIEAVEA